MSGISWILLLLSLGRSLEGVDMGGEGGGGGLKRNGGTEGKGLRDKGWGRGKDREWR